jgi:hypothetical protein
MHGEYRRQWLRPLARKTVLHYLLGMRRTPDLPCLNRSLVYPNAVNAESENLVTESAQAYIAKETTRHVTAYDR